MAADKVLLSQMFDPEGADVYSFRGIFRDRHLLVALPQKKKHALRTLSLYQPQSLKARLFILYVKCLIRVGMMRFLPEVKLGELREEYSECLGSFGDLGFLLGNPAAESRKLIAYHYSDGCSLVTKIGVDGKSSMDVLAEYRCLERAAKSISGLIVPEQMFCNNEKKLASFTVKWVSGRSPRRQDYGKVCEQLQEWIRAEHCKLVDLDCWKLVLENSRGGMHEEHVAGLNDKVPLTAPIHGDFAPWNIKVGKGGKVFVLDWESYQEDGAAGWDWAHYLVQSKLLIDKMHPHEVIETALYWAKSKKGSDFLIACGWGEDSMSWLGSYLFYAQFALNFDREKLIECWKEKVEMCS